MRRRIKRNLLATLAFSQGVPMLLHGDELGRTQQGNNNTYCQDNELSWVDWELDDERRELLPFARRVFRIRRENPVFRRRGFFAGGPIRGTDTKDVSWLRPDGKEMGRADWGGRNHVLGMLIHGHASDEVDERGRPNVGETLLLMLNGGPRAVSFNLPALSEPGVWREAINTARPSGSGKIGAAVHLHPTR
jgi:glycogen operon protein